MRNKLPNLAPLPSKSTIDNFARPITQITDARNNTIAITPKRPLPKTEERNLSKQLNQFFQMLMRHLKKNLKPLKKKVEFEFEFFTGGTNQKFDSSVQQFGLSSENMEFLDFLEWDYCKEMLEKNDLKIHIETGNIYYEDNDINKSIFEFMKNQQDSTKGKINFDLMYDGNYKDYFRWILNGFDVYEKTKLDFLIFKNTKYLYYCFNDFLESQGQPLIKIKHSKVTDDCIAAEEI